MSAELNVRRTGDRCSSRALMFRVTLGQCNDDGHIGAAHTSAPSKRRSAVIDRRYSNKKGYASNAYPLWLS